MNRGGRGAENDMITVVAMGFDIFTRDAVTKSQNPEVSAGTGTGSVPSRTVGS